MKVFDIITESRQQLAESMLVFGRMLAYAVSKGGAGLEHALSYIARSVASKPTAAKDLAEAWILTAEKAGIGYAEARAMGVQAAKDSRAIADNVIAAAEREATELAAKKSNSVWGKLKTPDSELNFWYGAGMANLNLALTFWQVGKPVYDCVQGILKVYRMHDEGHPELQDKNKLQWAVQWYIDRATGQIVTALLTGAVLKKVLGSWVPGVAYNVPVFGKLIAKLDPIYSKLPPAAQAGFKVWITSEAGQEAVAKWLAGELLMPGTEWKIPGGKAFRAMVIDPLSGTIKSAYDGILRMIDSDKAQQLPEPKKDAPNPVNRYDLRTGQALNPSF